MQYWSNSDSSRIIYLLVLFNELANHVIFGLPFLHTAEKFVCRISRYFARMNASFRNFNWSLQNDNRILRYEIVTRFKLERKQTKAIRYKTVYAWSSNIDLWWIGQTKEKYRDENRRIQSRISWWSTKPIPAISMYCVYISSSLSLLSTDYLRHSIPYL